MTDENTNEEKSFVYIEFEGIGSAEITNYNLQNVSPLQLLAMASYMEFEGKAALSVQRAAQVQANLERQQLQRIAVPKSTIELGKK
jgi:hypothetical protein